MAVAAMRTTGILPVVTAVCTAKMAVRLTGKMPVPLCCSPKR